MNVIITGDSFCAHTEAWPSELARLLGADLIAQGFPGRSWWPSQQYLASVTTEQKSQCCALVVCHTNSWRIHSDNPFVTLQKLRDNPNSDLSRAMEMYIKHIKSELFDSWSHRAWIREIDTNWASIPRVHLHSFPDSTELTCDSTGIRVVPALSYISLELSNQQASQLYSDTRLNHLSDTQNKELAAQLSNIILRAQSGTAVLDSSKFQKETQ